MFRLMDRGIKFLPPRGRLLSTDLELGAFCSGGLFWFTVLLSWFLLYAVMVSVGALSLSDSGWLLFLPFKAYK